MIDLDINNFFDVIVVGGGQAGLSVGYYLSKTKLNYIILDENDTAGGAWLNTWDSLRLFSPANNSSLPGWFMPKTQEEYPTKNEVINYLSEYEKKFKLKIIRNITVKKIDFENENKGYIVNCIDKTKSTFIDIKSKVVINCTGNFNNPFIPEFKNLSEFNGEILHSANYRNPLNYLGKKVLVVGGANSGAQILAEVSLVTETTWSTHHPPVFLPDDIDGRDLFNFATAAYLKGEKKSDFCGVSSLGDIVMIPSVKEARKRDVLYSKGQILDFYSDGVIWSNQVKEEFDVVIFCTGFKNNLFHLENLSNLFDNESRISLIERDFSKSPIFESKNYPNLYFIGYGNWTGYASATLIGVGRYAKSVVTEIVSYLI